MKRNNRRAFTIVELVIVVAVIAVLAAVLIPTFGNVIDKARDSRALQEAKAAYTNYFIEQDGTVPTYMIYVSGTRFVALQGGTPVGLYGSAIAALLIMGLDPSQGLVDLGDGKLFAWGGDDWVTTEPVEPIEPIAPVEPTLPVEPPAQGTYYSVTLDFIRDHISIMGDTTALAGSTYTAFLLWADNYSPRVKVVMGGEDITLTAYQNGTVTIPCVTGDIVIAAVADSIDWKVGAIDIQTGETVDATNRIYSDLIDVSDGATIRPASNESGAAFCPIYYNEDGTFAYAPDNFVTEALTLFPGQYAYIRLMVCDLSSKDDPTALLTPDYGKNVTISVGTAEIIWVTGTIDTDTGTNDETDHLPSADRRIRSGFFDLRQGLVVVNSSSPYFNVSYYDENMNIIPDAYSGYKTNWNSKAFSRAVYARIVAKARSADTGTKSITVTFTES